MNFRQALLSSVTIYLLIIPTNQYCKDYHLRIVLDGDDIFGMECTNIVDVIENELLRYILALDISKSNIQHLKHELLRNYTNVEYMSIRTSNITDIDEDAFKSLRILRTLDLSNNSIRILSKNTFNNLHDLALLDLSNNNITTVEENPIRGLENLYHLYLTNNNILTISPLLVNCEGVKRLDVSQNNISQIQLTDGCSNLLYLNISHNQLTEFNINTTTSSTITQLDLSWNNLSNFDNDSLKNLDFASDINLSNNPLFQIYDIPVNLFQNKARLQSLNLSATGIRNVVARMFANLTNLDVLDLSSNCLDFLPENVFHGLLYLKKLNLSNNRFIFWRGKNYPKLLSINLNNNMWSCRSLSNIIKKYQLIHAFIVPGQMHNISNILGVGCIDPGTNSRSDVVRNQSQKWVLLGISIVLLLIIFF